MDYVVSILGQELTQAPSTSYHNKEVGDSG